MTRTITCAAALLIGIFLAGCGQHYVTPGAPASMLEIAGDDLQAYTKRSRRDFTDNDLQSFYDVKPVAPFPTNMAVVRVQDSGYSSYRSHSYRSPGRYTVITTRDIESDEAFERLLALPDIDGVAPIGRMLVPANADSIKDLRIPAAQLRADMILVYTVDTSFSVDGKQLGPLSAISLGLLRNRKAHVTATVSGMLVDVRTGYIYGMTEATDIQEQRASIWSTGLAVDTARLRAEKKAFAGFVSEFEKLWPGVVLAYKGKTVTYSQANAPAPNRYHTIQFSDSAGN